MPQKQRAILTEQQAVDIFRILADGSVPLMVSSATFVANQYGINERTVRDIWKQRTWFHATCFLAQGSTSIVKKRMGRPIGSKDTRPRKQKLARTIVSTDSIHSPTLACSPSPDFGEPQSTAESSHDISNADYTQLGGNVSRRRRFSFLQCCASESSEDAFIGDQSPLLPLFQDEPAEETSIDDQPHAGANHAPCWIADAALPRRAPLLSKSSIC